MDQPFLDNQSDFEVPLPQLLLDKDGEKLVTLVKATFEVSARGGVPELAPPERRRPLRMADVPWGDPEVSSIAYPADLCLRKPGTDVVVVARAFAPGGQPTPRFDVLVRVGRLEKALSVYGLRVWQAKGEGLSEARPLDELELRYEHAWGGFDESDPAKPVEEARNPIGKGVARDPSALTHQPAPQLDDPAFPLEHARTRPPPAGVGAIGRHWEPRRHYAGTYDRAWREHRAPLLPDDFDDRYNLCASPGLVAQPPLLGGEPVALLNLVPGGGATAFALPRIAITIEFRVKDREPYVARPHLDTVLLDLLEAGPAQPAVIEMVWRAYVKAPRRLSDARVTVREESTP
jgi:hypothetical protein